MMMNTQEFLTRLKPTIIYQAFFTKIDLQHMKIRTVFLPYVGGISEAIKWAMRSVDIRVIFKPMDAPSPRQRSDAIWKEILMLYTRLHALYACRCTLVRLEDEHKAAVTHTKWNRRNVHAQEGYCSFGVSVC